MARRNDIGQGAAVAAEAAPASAGKAKRGLGISRALREDMAYRASNRRVATPEEARRLFAPPQTLGAPKSARMALDAQMETDNVYTLIQHSMSMGMYQGMSSFLGYGMLQNIAQNGLIRACIETVADDMTRNWIELSGCEEMPSEADDGKRRIGESKVLLLTEEMRRLEMQKVFHEAASMTGYYGGCLIFLDTGVRGEALRNPLNLDPRFSSEANHKGFLKGIRVIDPVNVFVGTYNSVDPLAKDYYMPRSWWVLGQEVHASRLIRIVANEAPLIFRPAYNFLGIPQAQILWDYVMHFQSNRDCMNRLMGKFSTMVFKTAMADILNGTADDLGVLDTRMEMLVRNQSNDGVFCIDNATEDVVKVETPLGGVTDVVKQSLEIIAAMNRTPAVKLLGISPSGFNATGESDIRNYYDHVSSQQAKILKDGIADVLSVMQLSLFQSIDRNLGFRFNPLSEDDKASIESVRQMRITSLTALIENGVISPKEARRILIESPGSGLGGLDPDAEIEMPDKEGKGRDDEPGPDEGEEGGGVTEREGEDASLLTAGMHPKHMQYDADRGERPVRAERGEEGADASMLTAGMHPKHLQYDADRPDREAIDASLLTAGMHPKHIQFDDVTPGDDDVMAEDKFWREERHKRDKHGRFDWSDRVAPMTGMASPEVRALQEVELVREKYQYRDDLWLKAPNGEPTRLTETEWLKVRTPAFIEWFGDWINDPEHASKILDQNGEPRVVYHTTDRKFDTFDLSKAATFHEVQGFWFSEGKQEWRGKGTWVYRCFLNIRNPMKGKPTVEGNGAEVRRHLMKSGHDGIVNEREGFETEYAAFEPTQIKSATQNKGTFDPKNPCIYDALPAGLLPERNA